MAGNLRADVQPLQQGSKVQFSQLPGAVQTAVKSQAGTATIEDVERGTLSGRTVYEIAFKDNGKHTELRVGEDGAVVDRIVEGKSVGAQASIQTAAAPPATTEKYVHLQNGQKVQMSDVPPAVQNAIKTQAAGASIDDIDRGTLQGKTVYEAAFKHDGKHNELRVGEDGNVVARYVEGQNLDIGTAAPTGRAQVQQSGKPEVAYNAGFKESFNQTKKVGWATLPQHVRQAIRDRAGAERKFDDAEHGITPTGRAYQVAYKMNGKHVETRVSHDGKRITEVHDGKVVFRVTPVTFQELPPKVQKIVRDHTGETPIERVQEGVLNNAPFYRVNYVKNGQPMELRLERDGSNVKEMAVAKSWVGEPAGAQKR